MTDAKAIRNSVEGRDGDPFRDPADAIGRAVSRGPSASDLHSRAIRQAVARASGRCEHGALVGFCTHEHPEWDGAA